MKVGIYLPIWFLESLSERAQDEILKGAALYRSNTVEDQFEIKLVENELYAKCSREFKRAYETEDKLFEQERELKYLRQIKESVDHVKKLLKT